MASRTWPALDVLARHEPAAVPDLADRLALLLDDLDPLALDDDVDAGRWRVYFADAPARDHAATELTFRLGADIDVQPIEVEDEGWALKVQEDLRAVRVGQIVVAPPWDVDEHRPHDADGPAIVVVIEPSMGFGTGHHQSTRLCLEALQAVTLRDARVIDVGTGSGVLAIAAARLGAGQVLAIDNDPDSAAAARDNVERNGVGERVEVRLDDIGTSGLEPGDIVVANLTAWLLGQTAGAIASRVRPGGRLVVGGFTADQVPLVTHAFAELAVESRRDEDDWVVLVLRRDSH